MKEWGEDGQNKLCKSSVVVIGAGGVKSTLLMCLVAAGVGRVRIIEFDTVEMSNLNRQILYRTSDIGSKKGYASLKTLQDLNDEITIELIDEKLTFDNMKNLLEGFDFIVEGGDCPYARNLVNEFSLESKIPMVHCSAQFSYGYVFSVIPQNATACFACIFPDDHQRQEHTGPVPVNVLSTALAGTLGAAEVIKWLIGDRSKMYVNGKRFFDSLVINNTIGFEPTNRNPSCKVCSKYYE